MTNQKFQKSYLNENHINKNLLFTSQSYLIRMKIEDEELEVKDYELNQTNVKKILYMYKFNINEDVHILDLDEVEELFEGRIFDEFKTKSIVILPRLMNKKSWNLLVYYVNEE